MPDPTIESSTSLPLARQLLSVSQDGSPGQSASRSLTELAENAPAALVEAVGEGDEKMVDHAASQLRYALARDGERRSRIVEGLTATGGDAAASLVTAITETPAPSGTCQSPTSCDGCAPSPVPDGFHWLARQYADANEGPHYWIVAIVASDGTGTARLFASPGALYPLYGQPSSTELTRASSLVELGTFPICNCVPHPLADPYQNGGGGPFPPTIFPFPWKVTAFCDADAQHPVDEYGPHYVRFDGPCAVRGTWLHNGGPGWCQGTMGCIRADQEPILYIGALEAHNPGRGRLIVRQGVRTESQMFPAH